MSKMKTSMNRHVPIIKDIAEQFEANPTADKLFLYDDGQVFRAYAVDTLDITERTIIVSCAGKPVVVIPQEVSWRLIAIDRVEFRTGTEAESARMYGLWQEHKLKEKLMTELDPESASQLDTAKPKKMYKKTKQEVNGAVKDKLPGMYL